MDELKLRALLHSMLNDAMTVAELIDEETTAHVLDSPQGMIRGAITVNELEIARQLKAKRETPALPENQ
jgi:hypothetical protein